MNDAPCDDQAASANAEISPNPATHEDLSPVMHNKSNKANRHEQLADVNSRPDKSEATNNICVNLDH